MVLVADPVLAHLLVKDHVRYRLARLEQPPVLHLPVELAHHPLLAPEEVHSGDDLPIRPQDVLLELGGRQSVQVHPHPAHGLADALAGRVQEADGPTGGAYARPALHAEQPEVQRGWREPEAQCDVPGGDGLLHRSGTAQVEQGPRQRGHHDPVDHGEVRSWKRRAVDMHDTSALALAAAAAGDVHLLDGGPPYGQPVQHGGGAVADHRPVEQLRRRRQNQPPMALLPDLAVVRDVRVRATANPGQLAPSAQSSEVLGVETLDTQGPGEHDVVGHGRQCSGLGASGVTHRDHICG